MVQSAIWHSGWPTVVASSSPTVVQFSFCRRCYTDNLLHRRQQCETNILDSRPGHNKIYNN
jgi:hypothetical protein